MLILLSSRETGWLANGAQLQARQPPLPLLLYENQRDTKLPRYGVAAISCLLDLTACQDGGIAVHAHLDLVQAERIVLQVTGLVSREPFLLTKQESEGPYTDEVIGESILKKSGITPQFGGCPGVCQTQHLLFGLFPVHGVTPFCRKLIWH